MNSINPIESDDPSVTVDVVLSVRQSCQEEFERILTEMIDAAAMFKGHLGVNVFRPSGSSNLEYRVVFKFDHIKNFQQWESSEIRKGYLQQINQLILDSGRFQIITGLETWFTLSTNKAIVPPPRYKMFILSWATIFIIVNLINLLIVPHLQFLPPLLRTFITLGTIVFTMTYIVMPRITKLFAKWLYSKS